MYPIKDIAPYIFGIILLAIVIYIIVYVIYPSSGSNDMLPNITPLNTKKDVVTSNIVQTKILGSAGSTVMGFFKLDSGDRTIKSDITFIPVMFVESNWYLEIAQSPVKNVSARLRVITNKYEKIITSGQTKPTTQSEIIELPPIPKQKWVFIAILRDGRRFDIIYDNKIVGSQRIPNYPVVISMPLSIGNKQLNGSAVHIVINGVRLSPNDVESERITHVDTNNMVIEANPVDMSLPGLNLFAQCPPGLPCKPITRPPNNSLLKWDTPYA